MSGIVDDRLLERWEASRRHQDQARRFLVRRYFADPVVERRTLDEIVATLTDLEQELRERAARRAATPSAFPPHPAAG